MKYDMPELPALPHPVTASTLRERVEITRGALRALQALENRLVNEIYYMEGLCPGHSGKSNQCSICGKDTSTD